MARPQLTWLAKFCLFATSYIPLFTLIVIKQFGNNKDYLHWGGISIEALTTFLQKFGASTLVIAIAFFGSIGFWFLYRNMQTSAEAGFRIRVKDTENKNSEAISYIGTYIIPFIFQDYGSFIEFLSLLILLVVIYKIYINSSLLLINPTLTLFLSLYQIEYEDEVNPDTKKSGLLITKERELEGGETIQVVAIGKRTFFSR